MAQPGKYAYLVVNQDIADATANFPKYQEQGIVVSGNSAEELATNLGIDATALADTFSRYQASIAKGKDEFNKTKLPANWDGPYYAIRITADLRHTQGGLVTDTDAHVLRENGSVIQGLYAAGGVTEGFTSTGGAAYMSGDGLLQAFVFGRIAGKNAATETKGNITATTWTDTNVKESLEEKEISNTPNVDTNTLTYKDGKYDGTGKGHSGETILSVVVKDGKVNDIELISHGDTEEIFASALEPVLTQAIENNGTSKVDTVAGATNSSNGLIEAINNALAKAQ